MQPFIDKFLAENCRGEALLAERLNRFVTFRQLALMASAGNEARAGAAGQDGANLFGVETLDLSSTHALFLFARAPSENYTALVETDSAHPRPVAGFRRVGKGLLVYVPQKMFGRGVDRCRNGASCPKNGIMRNNLSD